MENPEQIDEKVKLINSENEFSNSKKWYRQIFGFELLMFLYGFIDVMEMVVIRQYIFHRVQLAFNLTNSGDVPTVVCVYNDTNRSVDEEIQNISLNYVIKISIAFSISVLLTAPIYIILSKKFSGKPLVINVGLGLFIKSIFVFLVIQYDWSLKILIGIDAVYGLTGGVSLVFAICFSFIANTCTEKARNRRIVLIVLSNTSGCILASFSSGYFIKRYGFFLPFLTATIVTFGCVLYPLVFIHNLNSKTKEEDFNNISEALYFIKSIFNKKNIFSYLTIIVVMYGCYFIGENAAGELTSYVLLSYPICMSSVQFGYSVTVAILVINIGLIITGTLFNEYFHDLVTIIICLLSGIAFNMQLAYATTVTAVFIAYGSNFFSASGGPFIKGYLSKQIKTQNQTGLFIGFTFIETILGCVSRGIVMVFYHQTLKYHKGLVYKILACFLFTSFLLAILLLIWRKKHVIKNENERSRILDIN